jgi:hypothetical protein
MISACLLAFADGERRLSLIKSKRVGNRNGNLPCAARSANSFKTSYPMRMPGSSKFGAHTQCFCSREVADRHDPLWVTGYLNERRQSATYGRDCLPAGYAAITRCQ